MKFLILAVMLSSTSLYARLLTKEQKLSDLNELVGHIKSGYGPLDYKKINFGIDVDKLKSKYESMMMEAKTNADFYYLMVKFVAEFNDSHFGVNLPTDLVTTFGFNTDLIAGKVLIDEINREKLPQDKFPFEKGDEVVSIDGILAFDIVSELATYMGQGFDLSAKRKAAQMVTKRKAFKVPARSGKSKVEIRRGDSKITEVVELEWIQSGKFTDEFSTSKIKNRAFNSKVNYGLIDMEEKFRCSGETRVKIPADATVIMKTPFVAYYYPTAKGNVGYLRLPHYSPEETDKEIDAYQLRFNQYEYAVSVLEKNTVGLIIDQDHNCGGSVDWLHRMLTLFVNKAYEPMQFELLANKETLLDFTSWTKSVDESTIEYHDAQKVIELIKNTWLNSNDYLTVKTAISGDAQVFPNRIQYTKPIIVLIDEMSGSGGDAFPSMMQGLGRAKLLGTRTMGAGGHVIVLPPLSNSQLSVRMTKSLFYRPDGVAVENNGAHPDISYSHSVNDFKYGYQEYQKFFTDQLLNSL